MDNRDVLLDALAAADKDGNVDVVRELALRLQQLDQAEAPQSKAPTASNVESSSTLDQLGSFLKENMELPVGLAGGIGTGIAAGAVAGPVGAIVGGVVGGAVGSGAGSLLSDYMLNEKLDYTEAGKEAMVSAGMDLATLGTFRAVKTGLRAVGFGADEMAELSSRVFQPVKDAFTAGTTASLKATQELLEAGGGSLSAFQTGAASGFRKVSESIGDLGVLSRNIGESRRAANSAIIKTNVQNLIDGRLGDVSASSADIGSEVFGLISGARKAAIAGYGAELSVIKDTVGSYPVSTAPYTQAFRTLLRENTIASKVEVIDGIKVTTPLAYRLEKEAVALAKEYGAIFRDARSLNPQSLFDFEKKITAAVDNAGQFGSGLSTKTQHDLMEVRNVFRDATETVLSDINPAALEKYRALNKVYGETMEGLLPDINRTAIASGNKDYFEAIGSIALNSGSTTKLQALMGSIDKSFAVLAKEGVKPEGVVKSAKEAKELIRQGYLKNIFGDVEGNFDMKKFASQATSLEKPSNAAKAKVIMGDAFPEYKQLLNAMLEATKEPKGFVGSLVLRAREASSVSNIAAVGQAGGAGAAYLMSGPVAAVAVLGVPTLLSKLATNKTAIRKLLLMNTESKKLTGEPLAAFVTSGLGKIIAELPEADKSTIRDNARQLSRRGPPKPPQPQQ